MLGRISQIVAVVAFSSAVAGGGAAATSAPLHRQLSLVEGIDRAMAAGRGGDPAAMQVRYEAARDLAESLRRVTVPPACVPLASSLSELATSEISLTEAFDRVRTWWALEPRSGRARRDIDRDRGSCRAGGTAAQTRVQRALSLPGHGEAFFGRVEGGAPDTAVRALIDVNGVRAAVTSVRQGRFSTRVSASTGTAIVTARFLDSTGKPVGVALSRNTWQLPRSASVKPAPTRVDRALAARLSAAGLGFDGYAAIRTEDLTAGTVAGWNEDALFPAASTVKLAVMIEAAHQYGLTASSPVLYDVEHSAAWSSNLAANRMLALIGRGNVSRGVAAAQRRLRALGATSSTYPGAYRAGTSLSGAPRQPPLRTGRVTTARDLATVLRRAHLAATGDAGSIRATGLSASTARVLLRMLLESEPVGDNAGMIRQSLRVGTPAAQKNGWLSDARATAAIAYTPTGPVIIVVMGYRAGGLSLRQAQQLGANAARLSLHS